jgi:hypothetical protein
MLKCQQNLGFVAEQLGMYVVSILPQFSKDLAYRLVHPLGGEAG